MTIRSLLSTSTSAGLKNCPTEVPRLPKAEQDVPVSLQIWMRSFKRSAMMIRPWLSTATPVGSKNWPGWVPALPKVVQVVASKSQITIRSLLVSLITTRPSGIVTTSRGELNGRLKGGEPSKSVHVPEASHSWIRSLPLSAIRMLPTEETVTPRGLSNSPDNRPKLPKAVQLPVSLQI